jgi:hypothetical protein
MKTIIALVAALNANIAGAVVAIAQVNPTVPTQPNPTLQQSSTPTGLQVQPIAGRVTVTLINQTYVPITYQAIRDTSPRTLAGRSTITLRSLRAPATLTFDREDAGLLKVQPQVSSVTSSEVQVTLSETTDLSIDRLALRVEQNGAISLN